LRHEQTINRRAAEGKAGGAPSSPAWAIPGSLAAVLLAAALFRAVYFYLYAQNSLFFDGLILDSSVYDSWARAISGGEWLGRQVFYFPPLYPYALGLLFKAIGRSLAAVYLLQALLGLVCLVLIYRIGTATFNERVALMAAGGASLYGPFAFFEMKVLGATLGLTLNLLALALLIAAERAASDGRRGALRWLLAGLTIGAAAECLPGTILLAPLYAGYLGLRRGGAAIALLAGTFLATAPVLAHNLYVASDPLPLSGQGGLTFYQGNHPHASGLYGAAPGFSGSPESQAVEEQSIAERDTGRPMRRSETSAYFLRKGLAFIASSPGSWLIIEARKLLALMGDYEASTEYSLYFERQQVPWLRVLLLPFAAIAGAGLAGLILAGRPRPPTTPLFLYTVYAAAIPLIFYVSSRYRLPLVPALLVYGAFFIDRVRASVRQAGMLHPPLARAAAAALGLGLVSFFPLGRPSISAEANVHYNIGNLLAAQGRHEEAIASFDRALAQWPGNAYAWINRGNSLDKLGREDEALASYQRAEEENRGFWLAYKAQGVILHRQRRYPEEEAAYRRGLKADGEEAYYLLGVTLKNLDRLDEAVQALEQATRINPAYARAHTRLGEIYASRGDTDRARDQFRKAIATDPGDSAAVKGLARLGG
jgi:tetratricopeptide (TPR) repeat protein